ncbi:hypothetical protein JYU34_014331 [Plutella xylostella]|uniref:Uncharacterized protein n=1 Tax=Plutella xylostella TaxID=51655 RepID=A0ABQ7Q818_PLUXY|nr:hypothetical protein JYU34_014331 [Plutella xylostella]
MTTMQSYRKPCNLSIKKPVQNPVRPSERKSWSGSGHEPFLNLKTRKNWMRRT